MARVINANALAKLATQYGTEPINIIEIGWVDGGPRTSYSDRDIAGGIQGKILEVSGLDDIIQVSGGGDSQQITIKLDDHDGTIKAIMDSTDIHKRPCWVYQWFDGLLTSDKFLIFKGQLSSPIEWDEGDRSITLDVISKIEDVEVGFSIEEGDFSDPPEDLIGKPWPLCFGTVINVPALKAQSVRQGILATGNGIADFTIPKRLEAAEAIICPENFQGFTTSYEPGINGVFSNLTVTPVYVTDADCLKRKCEAIELLELQRSEQAAFQYPTMTVFGGDKFPQGVEVVINVGGGKFIGVFSGETFTVTGRRHPRQADNGQLVIDPVDPVNTIQSECGDTFGDLTFDITNDVIGRFPGLIDGVPGQDPVLAAEASKYTWNYFQSLGSAGFFWANAGDVVTLDEDQSILYIANILPSTVLRVAAWRELNGRRQLLTVPAALYTVRQTDYNTYDVCEVVFDAPLSSRGEGWEDDIYVSLTSSEGPNTVDIIEWFITKYTDFSIDATSFNAVNTAIDNYPMHFPLLERKNIITVLQEIAYQARCALWLRDDVFYIKYLAATPTADSTMGETDVDPNSLKVYHTPTEDLITKYVVEWKKDYAVDEPNKVILRHNVSKYGTHEQTFNYYCFNIIELVRKSATFWLIRTANTWRKARFSTPIHKLASEVFDTLNVTLDDVGDGTFFAIVEKANYNSDSNTIEFDIWTPIKSGTRVPYDFAFPADVQEQDLWPTNDERDRGFAGSGTGPNFSVIAPNDHPLSNTIPGLAQGFQLGGCVSIAESGGTCRNDFGDTFPSDEGDVKPFPNVSDDQNGAINTGTQPVTTTGSSTSGCCAEALKVAKQALDEAQNARTAAENAAQNAGNNDPREVDEEEALDELPAVCGGECIATVQTVELTPTLITFPGGGFGSDEGDTGDLAIADFGDTECFSFNSTQGAVDFRNQIESEENARASSHGWVIGTLYRRLISFHGLGNQTTGDEIGEPCPEPGTDDRQIVGYVRTPE